MIYLVVVFTLATVVLSLSASHIMAAVAGHESTLGLPANGTFVPALIGLMIGVVAIGTLLAPFALIVQGRSNRRRRRLR